MSDEPAIKLRVDPAEAAPDAPQTALVAARRTADTIEQNPLGVIVGGLALGVIAGALIPKSAREKAALAPVGKRIVSGAKGAASAAREAAAAELNVAGISRAAARDQIRKLAESVVAAARSATDAAKAAASEAAKPGSSATAPAEAQSPAVPDQGKAAD